MNKADWIEVYRTRPVVEHPLTDHWTYHADAYTEAGPGHSSTRIEIGMSPNVLGLAEIIAHSEHSKTGIGWEIRGNPAPQLYSCVIKPGSRECGTQVRHDGDKWVQTEQLLPDDIAALVLNITKYANAAAQTGEAGSQPQP